MCPDTTCLNCIHYTFTTKLISKHVKDFHLQSDIFYWHASTFWTCNLSSIMPSFNFSMLSLWMPYWEKTNSAWGNRVNTDWHEVWTWTPVMHSAFWLESTNLILTVGQSLMTILLYMFCCCNTMAYNREWSEIPEIRRVTLKEYWKDVEIHILYIKDRCSYTDIRLRPYPYLVYQARVVTCACPKVYPTLLLFLTVMCIVILKNDNLLTWY